MSKEDATQEYGYDEPKFPVVIFGDGHWAVLIRKEYKINRDGKPATRLLVRPTAQLRKYFNIKDERLIINEGYAVWCEFDNEKVVNLNDDPVVGTILVLCDFNGVDTKLTTLLAEYLRTIDTLVREVNALKSNISYLSNELEELNVKRDENE
jgi:hypothetical protein